MSIPSRPFAEEHTCHTFGNVWAKTMIFHQAGDEKVGHIHDFDHLTVIGQGGFRVQRILLDGTENVEYHYAPAIIEVPQGEAHSLTALADNSLAFCIETTVVANQAVERAGIILNQQERKG